MQLFIIGFLIAIKKINLQNKYTDNYFDNQHNFSIYSAIGIGAIKYNTFSDTLNTNPNSDPNSFDYIYETEISDEITFLAPISIGFKWKMNPYVQGRVYGTYNTLLSDDIDNIISGSNDSYASLGFTINYAFHKITRVKKERISIDLEKFDLTDEDGDGVIDLEDLCHHTPKKVEVDSKGCPKDKDKDGVPDYLDIEPDSKYILHVDELGRSLTDSIIYYRSQTDDSVEIEINKTFSIDTITNLNDSINVDIEKSTIPMDTILLNKDSNKLFCSPPLMIFEIFATMLCASGPNLETMPNNFQISSLTFPKGWEGLKFFEYSRNAPTLGSIDIPLSFKTTNKFASFSKPAWLIPSKAIPAVIAPSPITETTLFDFFESLLAMAMPSPEEIDVELCAAPNGSYSLSDLFVKPDKPCPFLKVLIFSFLPVSILWG